ncbi:MAG: TolC family protein [Desulfuromonadales bacterium]|nr:TolC family protein [Desulfuromonadales bacterium]
MKCQLILLLVLIFFTTTAHAEPRHLTLEKALALAAEQNYAVRQAQESRVGLDGRYVEERAAALPQLTASAGIGLSRDASQEVFGAGARQQNESAEISLTQPLFTWGKVGAGIRAAKVAQQSGDQSIRSARQGAHRDVTVAFVDLLLAVELQRLAGENLLQKGRHQQEAERRYALGVATDYDLLAATVATENARPETIRSANRVRSAQQRLAYLLALPDEVIAEGELAVAVAEPITFAEALQVAVEHRPELADLRLRQQVQREIIRIYGAENKPRLDLRGSAGWRRLELDNAAGDQGSGSAWNAGVYLTWPFFDGLRTAGKITQARSDLRGLSISERALVDAIGLEVETARNNIIDAAAIVAALQGTVGQAERLLQMAEQGFEYGVKTRLDVDDAQLNLLQAQTSLAQGERDYRAAEANFLWAMGKANNG